MGGNGRDRLVGGTGADAFVFRRADLRGPGDVITDMTHHDHIDLARIDANVHQAGNDAFAFVGAAEFTGAGQLRLHAGVLQGDVDGDGVADLVLRLLRVQDLAGMDFTL